MLHASKFQEGSATTTTLRDRVFFFVTDSSGNNKLERFVCWKMHLLEGIPIEVYYAYFPLSVVESLSLTSTATRLKHYKNFFIFVTDAPTK